MRTLLIVSLSALALVAHPMAAHAEEAAKAADAQAAVAAAPAEPATTEAPAAEAVPAAEAAPPPPQLVAEAIIPPEQTEKAEAESAKPVASPIHVGRLPGLPPPRATATTCSVKAETGEIFDCKPRK